LTSNRSIKRDTLRAGMSAPSGATGREMLPTKAASDRLQHARRFIRLPLVRGRQPYEQAASFDAENRNMHERLFCPKCGQEITMPAQQAGGTVACTRCGHLFTAQSPAGSAGSGEVPPMSLGYAPTGAVHYVDPTRPSGKATAALVCGFVALLNFVAGICAIIIARKELAAIDAGQSSPAGRQRARAGMIVAIFAMAINILLGGLRIMANVAREAAEASSRHNW